MLYPTKASRWIHWLLRAVCAHPGHLCSETAIFFIYLLIIYPVLYGTEKALPQPAWGSAFSYPLRQRIRVASSPKGRAIGRPGSPLLNAECFRIP